MSINNSGVRNWLERLDMVGAGHLAPDSCRRALIEADEKMAVLNPIPCHFAEFPLLGEPGFDMTWGMSSNDMINAEATSCPRGAKELAALLDPESAFLIEYDLAERGSSSPAVFYKGCLANGGHALGRMLQCAGRGDEARNAMIMVALLASMGYRSRMCGIMMGRKYSPIRVTAKPRGEFAIDRLIRDLDILGFRELPEEACRKLDQICQPNRYMLSPPLLHFDIMPDGTLGTTLGIELSGIKSRNADDYLQLKLACEWGIADDRWQDLKKAAFIDTENNLFLDLNTLKFRFRDGELLPAKLYLRASWDHC